MNVCRSFTLCSGSWNTHSNSDFTLRIKVFVNVFIDEGFDKSVATSTLDPRNLGFSRWRLFCLDDVYGGKSVEVNVTGRMNCCLLWIIPWPCSWICGCTDLVEVLHEFDWSGAADGDDWWIGRWTKVYSLRIPCAAAVLRVVLIKRNKHNRERENEIFVTRPCECSVEINRTLF